eukprot:12106_5
MTSPVVLNGRPYHMTRWIANIRCIAKLISSQNMVFRAVFTLAGILQTNSGSSLIGIGILTSYGFHSCHCSLCAAHLV